MIGLASYTGARGETKVDPLPSGTWVRVTMPSGAELDITQVENGDVEVYRGGMRTGSLYALGVSSNVLRLHAP